MKRRIVTLIRRSAKASRLGFGFWGTTKTKFPKKVLVRGKSTPLYVPQEGGYLLDLMNIWLDDEYGLQTLGFVPSSVLDVGANVGLFSLWAWHNFPYAKIHAYEPNPRIWPYLQANLRGISASLFQAGLGAKAGRADLVDLRESRMAETYSSSEGKIAIDSLADAINRLDGTVDLMKIDCEGAEWDLFKDRDSLRRVKAIRMEYHLVNGQSLEDFKATVDDLGFSLSRLLPNQGFGIAWLRRKGELAKLSN